MPDTNADISNIIRAALVPSGRTAQRDNMNIVLLLTAERGEVLSSAGRFARYLRASDVARDFGTLSVTNDFATAVFASDLTPVDGGGELIIGYWRADNEEVPASAGLLRGAEVNERQTVGALQQVADGGMSLEIDGSVVALAGMDFQEITTGAEAAAVINQALAGASSAARAVYSQSRFVITSGTVGTASSVAFAEPATGSFVGAVLGLAQGVGAESLPGAAAVTLPAETMLEAVTLLKGEVNYKGLCIIDQPTDSERESIAQWAQASRVLYYEPFTGSDYLARSRENVCWQIKLSNLSNCRMTYSQTGNRKLAAAYMSRTHVVNFSGEGTALTMQLKELTGVPAESFTQTEISAAKAVGLDIYTTMKDLPVLLTSGANDFTDNRYFIIAFIDALQTAGFNVLKRTGTKVPQTAQGVDAIEDALEQVGQDFVRVGYIAPGTWTLSETFGDKETFLRNIATRGFYVRAGELSEQSAEDREARKTPGIMVAVKLSGAFHEMDILIFLNY